MLYGVKQKYINWNNRKAIEKSWKKVKKKVEIQKWIKTSSKPFSDPICGISSENPHVYYYSYIYNHVIKEYSSVYFVVYEYLKQT